jgi:hypothetical protein
MLRKIDDWRPLAPIPVERPAAFSWASKGDFQPVVIRGIAEGQCGKGIVRFRGPCSGIKRIREFTVRYNPRQSRARTR